MLRSEFLYIEMKLGMFIANEENTCFYNFESYDFVMLVKGPGSHPDLDPGHDWVLHVRSRFVDGTHIVNWLDLCLT